MNANVFSFSVESLFPRAGRHTAAITLGTAAFVSAAFPPPTNAADCGPAAPLTNVQTPHESGGVSASPVSLQAASSQSGLAAPGCAGDIFPTGGDGIIDQDDFPPFVFAYDLLICGDPPMPVGCPADFDFDGFVDDNDFIIFAHAYNDYYCP